MPFADLPLPWVQKIFQKLSLVYGREFLSRWEGQDLSAVMADWAHELGYYGQRPDAIAHALQHLPVNKPPTVLEFRSLCRSSPDPTPALPAPVEKPEPERVAALLEKAKATGGKSPAQECYDNIMQIVRNRGGNMSGPQKAQIDAMRRAGLIVEAA